MGIKSQKSETWRWDKKTKLMIPNRRRMFFFWFKFLQIAIVEKHKINSKMYRGWGLRDINHDTIFENWWENHWVKLFGYKIKKGTQIAITKPKFELTPTIKNGKKIPNKAKSHYINWCIKVGQNLHLKSYKEIARHIKYPYQPDTTNITKKFSAMKSDYKKMLKNVCNGTFP